MTLGTSRGLVPRALGAALLDVDTYEEVEADTSATAQAATVVLVVAVASAIGASGEGSGGVFGAVVGAFTSWMIWAGVTNFVGTRFLGGTADWGELLRTLGFAQAPGILLALGIIPLFGGLVGFGVGVWMLVTGLVAIRQALDFGTGKALITALLSMVVVVGAMITLGILLGVGFGITAAITTAITGG